MGELLAHLKLTHDLDILVTVVIKLVPFSVIQIERIK
jgi:hypothetical protein